MKLAISAGLIILGTLFCGAQTVPLVRVHAHNDYEHTRPLLDALDQGFCSVEADIFLVKGKLLVAHTLKDTRPERTLEALYLDPLRERVRRNHGRVYAGGPEVVLLIDLKSDWHSLYPALRTVLSQYPDLFSTFRDDIKQTNAVTAIITGDRSLKMFATEAVRYAAYDGSMSDMNETIPATLVPWISADWKSVFKWNGTGRMPELELTRLRAMVDKAHSQGRRIRFWGSPDKPDFWKVLLDANVDLINTDDLAGAAKFLRENDPALRTR